MDSSGDFGDRGSSVSFHGLSYHVDVKKSKCGSAEEKWILRELNGVFRKGSMNAILGATGSGKTSLLDCLAARKDPKGLRGAVLVDGRPQPKNFKCMSGYVVQDDVVMGTLTVRENFVFSANLRLPSNTPKDVKRQQVDDTLTELGLMHVADSKVGNEFIRGISGGERKRTNIGMELIISPSVLFLDEPTTGLDASTANAVMYLLSRLAKKGRTIIFSIHQPRYSIFRLFDWLILLAQGRMVYQGESAKALDYFSGIGYECELHNNPPDFFLDIINGDSTAVTSMSPHDASSSENEQMSGKTDKAKRSGSTVLHITSDGTGISDGIAMTELKPKQDDVEAGLSGSQVDEASLVVESKQEESLAVELAEKFSNSSECKQVMAEVEEIYHKHQAADSSGTATQVAAAEYKTSFSTQLYYVSKRAVLNIIRNPQTSIMQVFIMIVFGVIVGLIYRDVSDDFDAGTQNRVGAFFFIVMNQVFGNLSAVELFIKERAIFIHENANGFYRVSAYFLAKVFCDVIPMRIIPVTFFAAIVYFMIGLQLDAVRFFQFVAVLIATTLTAASLGFFFSSIVRVFAIANLCIALNYVFMMVFGGFLVQLDSIDWYLRWIKYVSIFRYALNGLEITEFKDLTMILPNGTSDPNAGNMFLELNNIPYETEWDFWVNVVALMAMSTILFFFTYLALRSLKKYK